MLHAADVHGHTQVPSNLVLLKLGGRRWLGSLVIAWGAVAACCAFMRTRWQFFTLRIALGCAESGTMPGMWCAPGLWRGGGGGGGRMHGTPLCRVVGCQSWHRAPTCARPGSCLRCAPCWAAQKAGPCLACGAFLAGCAMLSALQAVSLQHHEHHRQWKAALGSVLS